MELYCIKTHEEKAVIAGKIYPLINDKSPCKCNVIDVGVKQKYSISEHTTLKCGTCGVVYKNQGCWWLDKERFVNIDSINIEEASECLNELVLTN